MTTGVNCGQVRGPIQLTFARSISPVTPLEVSITRVAVTRPEDAEVVEGEEGVHEGGKATEMGRKALVPYGLYRTCGFFTPHFAAQTGVEQEDLEVFWQALLQMWDLDRSASRGLMCLRGLYVFTHASKLGNAPAHKLFERVQARLRPAVETPRSFADYEVNVAEERLQEEITLTRLEG
jgi:CRISPR-associated protein Csd2